MVTIFFTILLTGASCSNQTIDSEEENLLDDYIEESVMEPGEDEPLVGGDKDEHGCIGSAGYTWCEAKQKCLRTWEEECTAKEVKEYPSIAEEVDWREYTNEKLWCPLKNNIKFERQSNYMQPGVQKLRFTSTVILSGERVEFECYVDVPEPSSRLEPFSNNVDYLMFFSIYSTSERIESEFFQHATTEKKYKYDNMYDQRRKVQLEKYKKIAERVLKYLKEAL